MTAAPSYHRERVREGALPLSTKLYQGIGALPDTYKNFAFTTLLLFYYNQVLGLPAARASLALTIALVIDAITDPLVGSLSDGFRSRLGRRHPFMYASALPLGISIAATFAPPSGLSPDGLFAWLLGGAVATRLAMTFFTVPWNALSAEFSDDYVERSQIVMWRYLVGWVGGTAFVLAVWSFVFPSTAEFTPGQLNPRGYLAFAPLLGLAVAGTALLSTHLTRREIPYLLQPHAHAARFSWRGFLHDLSLAARNRDFVLIALAILVSAAISGTAAALEFYMSTYFWGLTPEDLRWFSLTIAGSALAFAALRPLQARFEKHHILVGCALFNLLDGFVIIGLRLADVLPESGDPRLLAVLVPNQTLRVAMDTTIGIMFASMVADTLDLQELREGRRQEGLFSAVLSFAGKVTTGLGVTLAGLLLQHAIEMPPARGGGALDAETTRQLALVAGYGVPIFYLVPISFARFFRVTRARHAEIRTQLAQRHGERSAPAS